MISGTADAPLLRIMNAQTVLALVRGEGPLPRIDIARRLGMTKPTVSNVVATLLECGLVRELPTGAGGGRGARYEAVADVGFAIGVDVGGRHLRAALCDLDGRVLARESVERGDAESDELARLAAGLRDRLLAAAGVPVKRVAAMVVGTAGIVDPVKGRLLRLNPHRTQSFPIEREFGRALGHAAIIENDINLAALGEQRLGAGREVADFAFLSIGTGVGCGLILGGRLHRGHRGAAGELDMPGNPDSPAEHGLLACAADRMAKDRPLTPEAVFEAAAAGDASAREVLAELAHRIARFMASIAMIADVELIVLGGGIGARCAPLLPAIENELASKVHYPPRLAVSQLGEDPVLTGALSRAVTESISRVVAERLGP
ncbi:ROK family transcriptional regulator [Wenjunlia tyrosinilytica]|uniref:Sugar kinase n=1 Tax=Wenjunlia tyrosinilytica TaxID=1544741 RepID=A0A917ZXW6_9ACTN|nr:ROK family transcriptional regulator [Wenjunlia tyrosinilytica]GGP00624.1 sugar kinase [Wenjunlia tyrosinilytica]